MLTDQDGTFMLPLTPHACTMSRFAATMRGKVGTVPEAVCQTAMARTTAACSGQSRAMRRARKAARASGRGQPRNHSP